MEGYSEIIIIVMTTLLTNSTKNINYIQVLEKTTILRKRNKNCSNFNLDSGVIFSIK